MQGSEACDTFITKHVMEKTLSYDFWEKEISTINKLLAEMCGFQVIFFRVFLQSLLPPFFFIITIILPPITPLWSSFGKQAGFCFMPCY